MHNAQAADLTEDAGTGPTDLTCSHVHVRLATSLRRFVRPALPTWAVGGEDESRRQCGHGHVDLLQAGPGGDDPDDGLAHVAVDGPQGLGPGMRAVHDWPAIERASDLGIGGQFTGAQAPDVSAETSCAGFHKLTAARSLTG